MLFLSVEDFFQKVHAVEKLSREDEKACAKRMREGDADARQAIINAYLPWVASYIKRSPENIRTLKNIYYGIQTLEQAVDAFDFLQESETFSHRLSLQLKKAMVQCIFEGNGEI